MGNGEWGVGSGEWGMGLPCPPCPPCPSCIAIGTDNVHESRVGTAHQNLDLVGSAHPTCGFKNQIGLL
ncbi:MAG: hypothetical protein DSM106950_11145 [Stigonema ocellatum SAG 48.90 = DSM 106950]|nr:hypothetical protein [Stigonema ocellatum SAG 48.90 = DSM 106950]